MPSLVRASRRWNCNERSLWEARGLENWVLGVLDFPLCGDSWNKDVMRVARQDATLYLPGEINSAFTIYYSPFERRDSKMFWAACAGSGAAVIGRPITNRLAPASMASFGPRVRF